MTDKGILTTPPGGAVKFISMLINFLHNPYPATWVQRRRIIFLFGLLAAIWGPVYLAAAEEIPAPEYLHQKGIEQKTDFTKIADTFLGIPYREDGTIDEFGRFTQFENPDKQFESPGLNCSGFVLSASRFILGRNVTIKEAQADRFDDSGPDARLGKNWDFGWDLIFNLADGLPVRTLGVTEDRSDLWHETGESLQGFDLDDKDTWRTVLDNMHTDRLYLASLSKPTGRSGYRLIHYHVALLLADSHGGKWFYHTTQKSRTHKIDLNTPAGMNRLQAQFSGKVSKKILILEAVPSVLGRETAVIGHKQI